MAKEIIKLRYDDETRWLTSANKMKEALLGNDELEIVFEEDGKTGFTLLTDIAGQTVTVKGESVQVPE